MNQFQSGPVKVMFLFLFRTLLYKTEHNFFQIKGYFSKKLLKKIKPILTTLTLNSQYTLVYPLLFLLILSVYFSSLYFFSQCGQANVSFPTHKKPSPICMQLILFFFVIQPDFFITSHHIDQGLFLACFVVDVAYHLDVIQKVLF